MNSLSLKVFVSLMGIAMFTLNASETLLKIDDEPVSSREFLYIYEKNNIDQQADYSVESLENYLKLFVNYKLKVKQAKDLGLDKKQALKDEYEGYRRQLLESQIQKETLEPLVEQEYQRSLRDIGMSHIFIDVATENGKEKIKEAHDALLKGRSFEEVAEKYSEDELSKYKGGFVGYFTALQISIPEIEDAIYNTPVGKYSDVITTEKGYHIFKIIGDRPARRNIKVAIIRLDIPDQESSRLVVKAKIDSLYAILQEKGSDEFGKLAMQHSDDVSSKMKGGELDWFGINTYVKEFEDEAYSLEEDGDISKPFSTNRAWYIIKRVRMAEPASEEEAKRIIKTKLTSSRMYAKEKADFYQSLMISSKLEMYDDAVEALKEKLVPLIDHHPLEYDFSVDDSPLLSIDGENITEKDLKSIFLSQQSKIRGKFGEEKIEALLDNVVRELLHTYYEQKLIDASFEYGALLDEYQNGVLIFETTKNNVWDKAIKDTVGLQRFYKSLNDQYVWNQRAEVVHISAEDTIRIKDVLKTIKKNKLYSAKKWQRYLDRNPDANLSIDIELIEKDISPKSENIVWSKGVHTDREGNLYQVLSVIPTQKKELSEVRGKALADYQEFLESEWLKHLNKTYKVEVYQDVLQKLVK